MPPYEDGHRFPRRQSALPDVPGGASLPAFQPAHAVLPILGQTHCPATEEQHGVFCRPSGCWLMRVRLVGSVYSHHQMALHDQLRCCLPSMNK
ncbi:hypothetical protein AOLI_G00140100 [Acnodon oligacanthus]